MPMNPRDERDIVRDPGSIIISMGKNQTTKSLTAKNVRVSLAELDTMPIDKDISKPSMYKVLEIIKTSMTDHLYL